jgi:hypothetical protein
MCVGYADLIFSSIASRSEPVSFKRGLSFSSLAILAFTTPAVAQHPAARGVHPGGGAVHPGAQHMMAGGGQQHMTPQHFQNMQHQQMMNEQMLFESIMNSRAGTYRRAGANHSGGGQQPSASNRAQSGAKGQKSASTAAQPGGKQQDGKRAASTGNAAKQTKQPSDKAAKEKEAAATTQRKAAENLAHHNNAMKKGVVNNRSFQGSNQLEINHLKNAQSKMSRADHDYAGHRVRSMEHVSSALAHLGASSGFMGNMYSSQGNLPQAQSDQLLRDAEFHLKNVLNTIGTGNNTLTHHHNARASVEAAIHELHVALKIN